MPATVETSIGEQLKALIRLQAVDSKIDQVKKLRGDLPEEIRDLEDEKAGLETRIENYQTEAKQNEIARKQAELDIQDSEGLIKRYEEQQLQVRNNREYDALTKEIEAQRGRIAEAQARIEEIDGSVDERTEAIDVAKQRLSGMDDVLGGKIKELDEVLNDTKQEQEHLETMRQDASNEVDSRYLRAYERLRSRLRDGRAVVALERGAAGGFAVPPQRQVEIRQRNRIVACEHTGRIIVDKELFDETATKIKF
ncbi:MAG: hypothetical protein HKN43_07345 [Rhodothermales bacterium]|nr:hypothetical protein [Rhodothermales bacterium]